VNRLLILSCCFMLLFYSTQAHSAIYWVHPTDNTASWGAGGCRSEADPGAGKYCSLATANANLVGGDTVYLKGGMYRPTATSNNVLIAPANSGTSGNVIYYAAATGETPILTSQLLPDPTMEAAWSAYNSPVSVERSSDDWFEDNENYYSTKFTVNGPGQGIRSGAFNWKNTGGDGGYFGLKVKSETEAAVHVILRKTDLSVTFIDGNYTITPGQWVTPAGLSTYLLPNSNGEWELIITSPAEATSGTWYVDRVVLYPYMNAINLRGKSYIKVDGMTVVESPQAFLLDRGSSYNEILNCDFSRCYYYAMAFIGQGGQAYNPSSHNWIHHNTFHDHGYVARTAGAIETCDDIGNHLQIGDNTIDNSINNLIEDNLFYHGAHDLVIIRNTQTVFRRNVLHNEPWIKNNEGQCDDADGDPSTHNNPEMFGNRCLLIENGGDSAAHGFNNLVEGNRIGHTGVPPDDDGSNAFEDAGVHTINRYNAFYNTMGSGVYLKKQPQIYIGYATGDAETDVISLNDQRTNGDVIYFNSLSGGSGLSTHTPYFVVNAGTLTFQVAATPGGEAINFTTNITSALVVKSTQLTNPPSGESDTDIFTSEAHGLWTDHPVKFAYLDGGTGLSTNTLYYIVNPTANTFQISSTPRGTPVDFSSDVTANSVMVYPRWHSSGNFSVVYNNSIYHAGFGSDDITISQRMGFYSSSNPYSDANPWPTGVYAKNNIIHDWGYSEYYYPNLPSALVTYTNNFNENPSWTDLTLSSPESLTLPNLMLAHGSAAIDGATNLTVTKGSGDSSTTLIVDTALYFQDGSWGSALAGTVYADWIAIGTVSNVVQISSIDYQTNTITLASPMTWADDAPIWLYKKSDGVRVLYGSAPDYGAYEYTDSSPTTSISTVNMY